jgi:hypothetical protein
MKKTIICILSSIKNFFNRIIDKEAERVIELYRYIFNPDFK